MKNKIALITGASSGIGYATALALAHEGYDLILCGRREERLLKLSKQLENKVKSMHLVFDVSNRKDVFSAMESIPKAWSSIDLLVNNAGNAHGRDELLTGDIDDWDAMIDSNVQGLLYVTKAMIPGMVERKSGHIINISSIAGKETYTHGVVYCASKHAVESISDGLRKELVPYGIKVTNIAPGAVNTEFSFIRFKGDVEQADQVYAGFSPLLAEDIAKTIVFCASSPAHVQIADITVLSSQQYSATGIHKEPSN